MMHLHSKKSIKINHLRERHKQDLLKKLIGILTAGVFVTGLIFISIFPDQFVDAGFTKKNSFY